MSKPKVLVDVDDTIADTQHVLIEQVNGRLGTSFTFDAMTREHREKEIEGWAKTVREILTEPEVMLTTKPSEGALEAFRFLVSSGYEAHIVSSRQEPLHDATAKWLHLHGFARHIHRIHPRPTSERGADFKVRIAKEQGFSAAFDDTFDVVVALTAVVPSVYLIDKPWNRGHDDELPPNAIRVEDFSHGVTDFLMAEHGCPCVGDPPCDDCPVGSNA